MKKTIVKNGAVIGYAEDTNNGCVQAWYWQKPCLCDTFQLDWEDMSKHLSYSKMTLGLEIEVSDHVDFLNSCEPFEVVPYAGRADEDGVWLDPLACPRCRSEKTEGTDNIDSEGYQPMTCNTCGKNFGAQLS